MMEEMILTIEHVVKRYSDFCLDDVSLAIPAGCITGLIGENGAGKSTLIKLILNLIHPDTGRITIFGRDHREAEQELKEQMGVVLSELNLPDDFTGTMVDLIMKDIYKSWESSLFFQYLDRFSLPEKKKLKEYSKGMKMKMGIAIALSHHARLLILDEPTSGLDPVVRDEILDILQEQIMDESHSVLISSHILSDLEKISDYIAYLQDGKLLLFEEKDSLLDSLGILKCTKAQWEEVDPSQVIGVKIHEFGVEALVRRSGIPNGLSVDRVTLDDVMVYAGRRAKG